ncbi:hypothetical protein [Streptomyces sp. NRRL B-24484]|uniref:hypothetical protein n=1 Tax=Streptomyces sp. NRRL B-24484 TaxID=1463833 RepID=UPI0004C1876C|nr:hypothetical protein [Streptomyces sp. NRRL B-24484]
MTDELLFETAQAGCPRCEETTGITVFRERYRPVVRGQGAVRFLAAAVLFVLAAELLLGGHSAGVVPAAVGVLFAASCARAVLLARSGGPVDAVHCHQCSARSRRTS